jgi:hypothetical protein
MGKTSTILVASEAAERDGARVVRADLSTASSFADVTNRLLTASVRSLGRTWRDLAGVFVERLRISVTLRPDPVTGVALPTLEAGLRSIGAEAQRDTVGSALDALNELAQDRGLAVGIVLDEFQEVHRLGGETAEWHLRGVLERHAHLSYVLAGSRTTLVRRMISEPNRAFYKLLDVLELGPMDEEHFSRWIDERMEAGGRPCPGLGERCLEVAGPRTRDVVQLARACWRVWTEAAEVEELVEVALMDLVAEEDVIARTVWSGLTAHQQDVLRAVAGAGAGLTSRATLERFSLPSSGTVSNTAAALVEAELLVKAEDAPGYGFESPFFRGWVVMHTLPDIGMQRPVTWRATQDRIRP